MAIHKIITTALKFAGGCNLGTAYFFLTISCSCLMMNLWSFLLFFGVVFCDWSSVNFNNEVIVNNVVDGKIGCNLPGGRDGPGKAVPCEVYAELIGNMIEDISNRKIFPLKGAVITIKRDKPPISQVTVKNDITKNKDINSILDQVRKALSAAPPPKTAPAASAAPQRPPAPAAPPQAAASSRGRSPSPAPQRAAASPAPQRAAPASAPVRSPSPAPQRAAASTAPSRPAAGSIVDFEISVRVGDKLVEALLDSGAQSSVVHCQSYEKLPFKATSCSRKTYGTNGMPVVSDKTCEFQVTFLDNNGKEFFETSLPLRVIENPSQESEDDYRFLIGIYQFQKLQIELQGNRLAMIGTKPVLGSSANPGYVDSAFPFLLMPQDLSFPVLVDGRIQGKKIEMTIDSGATSSTIFAQSADHLKAFGWTVRELPPREVITVRTSGGNARISHLATGLLEIFDNDGKLVKSEIVEMRARLFIVTLQPYILVGVDFFAKWDILVHGSQYVMLDGKKIFDYSNSLLPNGFRRTFKVAGNLATEERQITERSHDANTYDMGKGGRKVQSRATFDDDRIVVTDYCEDGITKKLTTETRAGTVRTKTYFDKEGEVREVHGYLASGKLLMIDFFEGGKKVELQFFDGSGKVVSSLQQLVDGELKDVELTNKKRVSKPPTKC